MKLPAQHTAGDTLRLPVAVPGYLPQDGWTLSYALVNAGESIRFDAVDNGDGRFLVDQAAADTASWAPGRYRWGASLRRGTDRFTVATGEIEILPDLAGATTGLETRGRWARILDNLERAYEQMSAGEIQTAMVVYGSRTVQFRSLDQLIKAISHARLQAERERAGDAGGHRLGVRIHTRF